MSLYQAMGKPAPSLGEGRGLYWGAHPEPKTTYMAHSGGRGRTGDAWRPPAERPTPWHPARTHLDTSAMCKCRSSTHRSSSSSSSTAFSRASLSPVVSYLREMEGQGNQPTTRDPGADGGGAVSVPGLRLLVRVLFDVQQVIGHGLEGELMQQRGHRVRPPVHDEQL